MSKAEKPSRPSRERGEGSLFQKVEGGPWCLAYYRDDPATGKRKRVREYTGKRNRADAQKILHMRLTQVERGERFETTRQKTTVADLYESLKLHTQNHSRNQRAVKDLIGRWKHLKPAFAHVLAANLTTDAVEKYKLMCQQEGPRQKKGAAKASVNRELATLRRMFNLGLQSTPPKVHSVPKFRLFPEDNARQGFVEQEGFSRLVAEAGELWLRALLEIAWTYGWRKGELLGLRVRHINLLNRTIRLDPGTTKNGDGREVTMTNAVYDLLVECVRGKSANDSVFTRANGAPVIDFRDAWERLCVRAGLGEWACSQCQGPITGMKCPHTKGRHKYRGLLVHDLRRSACKAARKAGISETVVMAQAGMKSRAIFTRYAIVSSADQRDFVEMLERARERERAKAELSPFRSPSGHTAVAQEPKIQ